MRVRNEKMDVKSIQIDAVASSSIFLIGDAEVITCSSIFDTPADSFVQDPQIPIVTGLKGKERKSESS
ncbi:hypothetical protein [Ammoniphilus sp. 3BR4]|uniref:hypothetical protein n=1 Tax=Ammoniphilus sp. 3BR4 TaxID=3158265 RepID=UPI003467E728